MWYLPEEDDIHLFRCPRCKYEKDLENWIHGFPMVQVTTFDGKRICGTRSKEGFKSMVQPDPKTKECKQGYFKCGSEDNIKY